MTVWRRGAAAAAVLAVAIAAVVVLLTAAGGSNGTYRVRAEFDDVANLTPGEDVKIAEVQVGEIGEIGVTSKGAAFVSLHIENPGFQDFRADAKCTIIPQSLLGENYVNCTPTQPRPEGAPLPPPLKMIPSGEEGEGERLLPLSNTSSPVGVDQIQDITRLPEAQQLRIILNELGASFNGTGGELNQVIRRANPALQELEKVLGIFASQNHLLANLSEEGDRALAPQAANRRHLAGFIEHSKTVAKASAKQLAALQTDLAEFPTFLANLGPALKRVGKFAEQTTPTMTDLHLAAPAIDTAFEKLGPFAKSSNAYFKSLGKTAKVTGPALKASSALLGKLQGLGGAAKPFAKSFAELLSSKNGIAKTGGLERLMDLLFLDAGATNGYDALGHFLRAELAATNCNSYLVSTGGALSACSVNFVTPEGATGSAARAHASSSGISTVMARTLAVIEGMTPSQALAKYPPDAEEAAELKPTATAPATKPVGGPSAGTTYYRPGPEAQGTSERLLEYLLGS